MRGDEALERELEQLKLELDRINSTTSFGGNQLFDQTDSVASGSGSEAERNILQILLLLRFLKHRNFL